MEDSRRTETIEVQFKCPVTREMMAQGRDHVRRSLKFMRMFEGPDSYKTIGRVRNRYEKILGERYWIVEARVSVDDAAWQTLERAKNKRWDQAIADELKHRHLRVAPYPE